MKKLIRRNPETPSQTPHVHVHPGGGGYTGPIIGAIALGGIGFGAWWLYQHYFGNQALIKVHPGVTVPLLVTFEHIGYTEDVYFKIQLYKHLSLQNGLPAESVVEIGPRQIPNSTSLIPPYSIVFILNIPSNCPLGTYDVTVDLLDDSWPIKKLLTTPYTLANAIGVE